MSGVELSEFDYPPRDHHVPLVMIKGLIYMKIDGAIANAKANSSCNKNEDAL